MHVLSVTNRKRIFKIIAIINFVAIFFVACGSNGNILPTPFDVTPLTATSTRCPEANVIYSTPLSRKPQFVVFLVENSIESNDWVYEAESREIIKAVLADTVEPGDSIVIFKMGPLNFEESLLFDGRVDDVVQAVIPPSPTFIPSVTATNTPVATLTPGLYAKQTEVAATLTQGVIQITATHASVIDGCAQDAWEKQYEEIVRGQQDVRATVIASFNDQLNATATPAAEFPENYSHQVFESLQFSTLAFNQECKSDKYRSCLLIIFSNLSEYRLTPPDYFDTPINLGNVDVLSVLLNCQAMFDPSCKATEEYWSELFVNGLGAKSSSFIANDNVEQDVTNFIRSK